MKLHEIKVPPRAQDPFTRIKADPVSGCWLWQGHNVDGYGRVSWYGIHILVHRWVYANYIRPLKEFEEVHHKCKNPSCINPAHLEALDSDYHVFITQWRGASTNSRRAIGIGERVELDGYDAVVISIFNRSILVQNTDGEIFELERN